jgi:hypothetical protein
MAIPFACGDYLIVMFTNGDETLANSIKQSTQQRGENKEQRTKRERTQVQAKKSKIQIG